MSLTWKAHCECGAKFYMDDTAGECPECGKPCEFKESKPSTSKKAMPKKAPRKAGAEQDIENGVGVFKFTSGK